MIKVDTKENSIQILGTNTELMVEASEIVERLMKEFNTTYRLTFLALLVNVLGKYFDEYGEEYGEE